MAHFEPPHQDLRCLQIQLFASLVVKEVSFHQSAVDACFIQTVSKQAYRKYSKYLDSGQVFTNDADPDQKQPS